MSELSKSEVVAILGSGLSDAAIADIIATGIGKDELVTAKERVLRDHAAHNPGPDLEPGRFARVIDILERLHAHGILGKGGSRLE